MATDRQKQRLAQRRAEQPDPTAPPAAWQGYNERGQGVVSLPDGTERTGFVSGSGASAPGESVLTMGGDIGPILRPQAGQVSYWIDPPSVERVDQIMIVISKAAFVTGGLRYDFYLYGPSGRQLIWSHEPLDFFPPGALFQAESFGPTGGRWSVSASSPSNWILQLAFASITRPPGSPEGVFVRGFWLRTIRSGVIASDLHIPEEFYVNSNLGDSSSNNATSGGFYLANGRAVFERFATFSDQPGQVDDFWYESFVLDGLNGVVSNPVPRTLKTFNGQGRYEDEFDHSSTGGILYDNIFEPIGYDSDLGDRTFLSGFVTGEGSRLYTHSDSEGSTLLEVPNGTFVGSLRSGRLLTYRHPDLYTVASDNLVTQAVSLDRHRIVDGEIVFQENRSVPYLTGIENIGDRIRELNTLDQDRMYVFLPK